MSSRSSAMTGICVTLVVLIILTSKMPIAGLLMIAFLLLSLQELT